MVQINLPFFPANKNSIAKGQVWYPTPVFFFLLCFCISLQFWFSHFQSIFRVGFILFLEGPNEDEKCSIYITLQICLLLLSPFPINKFQRKILKVSRCLGSDLIKIQCFLCLMCLMCQCFNFSYKQASVSLFLFPHSGFCII